ncbi:MAG: OsmC family protein [Cyclobacteriaceae bacterium]
MTTITSSYSGQLRTQAVHVASSSAIITDAPTDNHGRGEAFSPTDLVAASLGSCMMTVMGIEAAKEGISLDGLKIEITKIMASNPRRIKAIQLNFTWPHPNATKDQLEKLREIAISCPVALSLHRELAQEVTFDF